MEEMTVDRGRFRRMFKGRAVVVTQLPPGYGRELATRVSEASGRRDVSLRTKAEHMALFELLMKDAEVVLPDEELALRDQHGQPTTVGQAIEAYIRVSQGKGEFFDVDMYMARVTGPDLPRRLLARPLTSAGNYLFELWRTDPEDHTHIPSPSGEGVIFSASDFSLGNCGNRTRRASKPSWRIDLQTARGGVNSLNGMGHIRLTSMYNDPSQMREALAWRILSETGVPSPRHTYVTVGNPFGPFVRGWQQVAPTLERAASLYRDGEFAGWERIANYLTPELAYIVEVDRLKAKVGGSAEFTPVALRATSVFRLEDNAWKLVHRHADPITAPRPAESVIQK